MKENSETAGIIFLNTVYDIISLYSLSSLVKHSQNTVNEIFLFILINCKKIFFRFI